MYKPPLARAIGYKPHLGDLRTKFASLEGDELAAFVEKRVAEVETILEVRAAQWRIDEARLIIYLICARSMRKNARRGRKLAKLKNKANCARLGVLYNRSV